MFLPFATLLRKVVKTVGRILTLRRKVVKTVRRILTLRRKVVKMQKTVATAVLLGVHRKNT